MSQELAQRYRLVTRSDFDGLVCAALLEELGILEEIKFVHPKDMQDGKVEVGPTDITTNLPYVEGVHLAFDHHESESLRVEGDPDNHVLDAEALSAARVVYNHYGGRRRFPGISTEMMDAVDRADSAAFSVEDILHPAGWNLLSFLMDPRTGLGRFRRFRISNYDLMMNLVDDCTRLSIAEILATPDVRERVEVYFQHEQAAREQVARCTMVYGDLMVLDLREEEVIHPTNRFTLYALFPECRLSIHVLWGLRQQNTVLAMGKSIVDRSSPVHVGELMLHYGGGGHAAAGTCQVDNDRASTVLAELVEQVAGD